MKTKTPEIVLREKRIYGNRLLIFRNVHNKTATATNVWAVLALRHLYGETAELDGKDATLYDWKADFEAGTIYVRGAVYLGHGQYQEFDGVFPCQKEEVALKPPGRNFEWNDFWGEWQNKKTGVRAKAY